MDLGSGFRAVGRARGLLSLTAAIFSRYHRRLLLRLKPEKFDKNPVPLRKTQAPTLSGIGFFAFRLYRNQRIFRSASLSLADHHHIVIAVFQGLFLRVICRIRICQKQSRVYDSKWRDDEPTHSQKKFRIFLSVESVAFSFCILACATPNSFSSPAHFALSSS